MALSAADNGIKFEIANNTVGSNGSLDGDGVVDQGALCQQEGEDVVEENVIRPGKLAKNTWIDMVEISEGCRGECLHCGAFEEDSVRTSPITEEQLEANLTQEIVDVMTGTRMRTIDLFRSYVTTGVDSEPLETDIFVTAAKKINALSDGKSRMVCITHGEKAMEREGVDDSGEATTEWVCDPNEIKRLEEINELMLQDVVPLFVLSVDPARRRGLMGKHSKQYSNELGAIEESDGYKKFLSLLRYIGTRQQTKEGLITPAQRMAESSEKWESRMKKNRSGLFRSIRCKITSGEDLTEEEEAGKEYFLKRDQLKASVIEANARSYAATIMPLIPAIKAGKRVTVSLQGDDDSNSLVYVGLTTEIWQRTIEILINEYGVSSSILEDEKLNVQPPRLYINAGRAVAWLGGMDPNRHCVVIPDAEFVGEGGPFRRDKFKTNRGRLRTNGDLEIQLYRGSRTYNDTVDPLGGPAPNPWKKVDLSLDNRSMYAEVSEQPRDFLDRMKYYARPRAIKLPEDELREDAEEQDLRTIYPLTQIKEEDNKKYWKLVDMVAKYLKHDFNAAEFTVQALADKTAFIDTSAALRVVMRSLIPHDYLLNARLEDGENIEDYTDRIIEEIIQANTPDSGVDGSPMTNEDKEKARKMGEILTVKSLLRDVLDLTIRVENEEEDPVEKIEIEVAEDANLAVDEEVGDDIIVPISPKRKRRPVAPKRRLRKPPIVPVPGPKRKKPIK